MPLRGLFILNCYGKWGASVMHTPHHLPTVFLLKVARIFGPLLLVDGRALGEPATRFYWSTGGGRRPASIGRQAERTGSPLPFGDRRIIDGSERISYPVSRAYICKILKFWFPLLYNEPISVSHFSSFTTHFASKQYNGWISMISKKTQIILQ